jgi:hypothetical protein
MTTMTGSANTLAYLREYGVLNLRLKKYPVKPSRTSRKMSGMVTWRFAPAFCVNPRGILVHRVRHVTTIVRDDGLISHHHVDYLCTNGCNVDRSAIWDVFTSDPPRDRLLCEFCEAMAKRKSLPSGDSLAGRHVHRGVLVARRSCCPHLKG